MGNQDPWKSRREGQEGPPQSQATNRGIPRPRPWMGANRQPKEDHVQGSWGPECLQGLLANNPAQQAHSDTHVAPGRHGHTYIFTFPHTQHTLLAMYLSQQPRHTDILTHHSEIFLYIHVHTHTHLDISKPMHIPRPPPVSSQMYAIPTSTS